MALTKVVPQAGIVKDQTAYSAEGFFRDADRVRFRLGFPEQVGGWQKYSPLSFLGTCRSMLRWTTLDFHTYTGLGTQLKFYIESGGGFSDVTPLRKTVTLPNDPLTTQAPGSSTLIVHDPSHGATAGSFLAISGATAVDGFTTGEINTEQRVTTVIDDDHYIITLAAGTAGTGGVSGGGAAVVIAYQINIGSNSQIFGSGWGAGPWGRGTWGSAYSTGIAETQLRLWSQANFGEDLVMNIRGGSVYYWIGGGVTPLLNRAVPLWSRSGANQVPVVANGVTVDPIIRSVIAFGANAVYTAGPQDPLLVRWSSQEDALDWEPRPDNTAGDQRLSAGSQILGFNITQQARLIWTDTALFAMSYVGAPFVFGFNLVSDSVSLISPNASAEARGIVYWMDQNNWYSYSGQVQIIPCPVRDFVFKNLNQDQVYKICTGVNSLFNEVWWFYPSTGSLENDSYVIYNYEENTWSVGQLERTAWIDKAVTGLPLASFSVGDTEDTITYLMTHELGYDDDGNPMESFVEIADVDIGDGEEFTFIPRMIPDITFRGSSSTPQVVYTIRSRNYPSEVMAVRATVDVDSTTTQNNIRVRGRQIAFRVASDASSIGWRLGSTRFDIQTDGQK